MLVALFFTLDYDNLSWSKNSGSYLGIISMIFVIHSLLIQIREIKKKTVSEKNK